VPSIGGGRVPCLEVLVNTGRVAERIADPSKTSEINEVVAEGAYYGMRTFDQALLELVKLGDVAAEQALAVASAPEDFKLMLDQMHVDEKPSFETDIKPLFRRDDKTAFAWAFDLWDAQSVRENASRIREFVKKGDIVLERPMEDGLAELDRWLTDPLP
jgi:Tfp pilus assembly ATPase PilU